MDGETEITMGPASQVDPGVSPAFDGVLETPNHIVVVWTIEWQKLLHAGVPTSRTRVRVWRNHPREPNEVIIGLG